MDGLLWQLVALKVSGLVSDMTRDVSVLVILAVNLCSSIESSAMRRVLHLKMVTHCAMLEDFGIFVVLADKVCITEYIDPSYSPFLF